MSPAVKPLFAVMLVATIAVAQDAQPTPTPEWLESMRNKAMGEITTGQEAARDRLLASIKMCADKCDPHALAKTHVALAYVYLLLSATRLAEAAVRRALELDDTVRPDADHDSAELDELFVRVQRKIITSEFRTNIPPKVRAHRPLPIHVTYQGDGTVTAVTLHYQSETMNDYRTIPMRRMGAGFGEFVTCDATHVGQLRYYVEGLDSSDTIVAHMGSRDQPIVVSLVTEPRVDTPAFPGYPPPERCMDTNMAKAYLASNACEDDRDCESRDCFKGQCREQPPEKRKPRTWIGVGGDYSFVVMPSLTNACVTSAFGVPHEPAVRCFEDGTGAPIPKGTKGAIQVASAYDAGTVSTQPAHGNARLWLSIDQAVSENVLLGVRLGGALIRSNYLEQPSPIHVEGRISYFFFEHALRTDAAAPRFSPYAFGGIGVSCTTATVSSAIVWPNGAKTFVDVSAFAGPLFMSAGVGLKVDLGTSHRVALFSAPFKVSVAFPERTLFSFFEPEMSVAAAF